MIQSQPLTSFMSFGPSPLLATMMLMTFSQFADIPRKIHLFYEQAFDTLFYKHDAVKELYQRKMYTSLTSDVFRKYFSLFCLVSYYEDKHEFTEDEVRQYIVKGLKIENANIDIENFLRDLTESICIIQKDGTNYVFSHRSFQEYFTAYCIDRVVQRHARRILDKIGRRFTDNTVPMLYDMNDELVEAEYVLPALEELRSALHQHPANEFVARHFELLDTRIVFSFLDGELADWIVESRGDVALKLTSLRRLLALDENLQKFHRLDDLVLAQIFPGWTRDKRLKLSRRPKVKVKITISVGRENSDEVPKLSAEVTGEAPTLKNLDWIEDLGYSKFCRHEYLSLMRKKGEVEKRRKAKMESLDQILELAT